MSAQVDVIVVGAGVAGLVAAIDLCRAGLCVTLLERANAVGGRVATDLVEGYRLDRGFQVLNTSYPQVRHRLDLDALDIRAFDGWGVGALRGAVATYRQSAASPGAGTGEPRLRTTRRR